MSFDAYLCPLNADAAVVVEGLQSALDGIQGAPRCLRLPAVAGPFARADARSIGTCPYLVLISAGLGAEECSEAQLEIEAWLAGGRRRKECVLRVRSSAAREGAQAREDGAAAELPPGLSDLPGELPAPIDLISEQPSAMDYEVSAPPSDAFAAGARDLIRALRKARRRPLPWQLIAVATVLLVMGGMFWFASNRGARAVQERQARELFSVEAYQQSIVGLELRSAALLRGMQSTAGQQQLGDLLSECARLAGTARAMQRPAMESAAGRARADLAARVADGDRHLLDLDVRLGELLQIGSAQVPARFGTRIALQTKLSPAQVAGSEGVQVASVGAMRATALAFGSGELLSVGQRSLLWRIADGALLQEFPARTADGATHIEATACDASLDGRQILIGDEAGGLALWQRGAGAARWSIKIADAEVLACFLLTRRERVLYADSQGRVAILDEQDGQLLFEFESAYTPLRQLRIACEGTRIVGLAWTGELIAWDAEDGRLVARQAAGANCLAAITTGARGGDLLVGGARGELSVWRLGADDKWLHMQGWQLADAGVAACCSSPSGAQLFAVLENGALYRMTRGEDVRGVQQLRKATESAESAAPALAIHAIGAGELLLGMLPHALIERLSSADGARKALLVDAGSGLRHLVMAPDGRALAGITRDGRLALWETASGAMLRSWDAAGSALLTCAFAPDGCALLAGAADGSLLLFDAFSPQLLVRYAPLDAEVTSCAFSPDGRQVCAASATGEVVRFRRAGDAQLMRRPRCAQLVRYDAQGSRLIGVRQEAAQDTQLVHLATGADAIASESKLGNAARYWPLGNGSVLAVDIGALRLFDGGGDCIALFAHGLGRHAIVATAVDAAGRRVGLLSASGELRVIDMADGRTLLSTDVPTLAGATALVFAPGGLTLFVAEGRRAALRRFELEGCEPLPYDGCITLAEHVVLPGAVLGLVAGQGTPTWALMSMHSGRALLRNLEYSTHATQGRAGGTLAAALSADRETLISIDAQKGLTARIVLTGELIATADRLPIGDPELGATVRAYAVRVHPAADMALVLEPAGKRLWAWSWSEAAPRVCLTFDAPILQWDWMAGGARLVVCTANGAVHSLASKEFLSAQGASSGPIAAGAAQFELGDVAIRAIHELAESAQLLLVVEDLNVAQSGAARLLRVRLEDGAVLESFLLPGLRSAQRQAGGTLFAFAAGGEELAVVDRSGAHPQFLRLSTRVPLVLARHELPALPVALPEYVPSQVDQQTGAQWILASAQGLLRFDARTSSAPLHSQWQRDPEAAAQRILASWQRPPDPPAMPGVQGYCALGYWRQPSDVPVAPSLMGRHDWRARAARLITGVGGVPAPLTAACWANSGARAGDERAEALLDWIVYGRGLVSEDEFHALPATRAVRAAARHKLRAQPRDWRAAAKPGLGSDFPFGSSQLTDALSSRDEESAVRAAGWGDPDALVALASWGKPQGHELLMRAARSGDRVALLELAQACRQSEPERALGLLELGAALGSEEARAELAEHWASGFAVDQARSDLLSGAQALPAVRTWAPSLLELSGHVLGQ